MAGVALYRCCAEPVTPLHIHVDLVKSPVFGKREVYLPGDAPKATRRSISTASRLADLRFGKGIRVKAAQAHESGNLDAKRIVEDFCISVTQTVAIIANLWYSVNAG